MERRRLGRTEHHSSVAILGGAAFWATPGPDEAGSHVAAALAAGVNHLDIAPQYGNAERVVGPHVPAVRDRLFVAGKTLRANPDGVAAQFDETRRLLGCEQLDLYQAHAVTTLDELDRRSAGIERILALRDAGATRFAGITGHDLDVPLVFLEALRRFDLDTVMFPVTPALWCVPRYADAAAELLATCASRDVGVMAIKATARRNWSDDAGFDGGPQQGRWATSWYEPWSDDEPLRQGIGFALSTPGVHAFCTPGDLGLLPRVLALTVDAPVLDAAARDGLVAAAARARADGDRLFPIPT